MENYIQNQFVTYKIALALRELGFNKECLAGYTNNKKFYLNPNYFIDIQAPLWQQAIDFFRGKYNLLIDSPKPDEWNDGKFSVKITSLDKFIVLEECVGQPYWKVYRCFKTYYEAREQAILKCIELCQK